MTAEQFHRFMVDPRTPALLDSMIADNTRADAEETAGPRPCCGEYAVVVSCDSTTDHMRCGVCGRTWTAPCPDADVWQPEPVL